MSPEKIGQHEHNEALESAYGDNAEVVRDLEYNQSVEVKNGARKVQEGEYVDAKEYTRIDGNTVELNLQEAAAAKVEAKAQVETWNRTIEAKAEAEQLVQEGYKQFQKQSAELENEMAPQHEALDIEEARVLDDAFAVIQSEVGTSESQSQTDLSLPSEDEPVT